MVLFDYVLWFVEKICILGGGCCNFMNLYVGFDNYLLLNLYFVCLVFVCYMLCDFFGLFKCYYVIWYEKYKG